MDEMEKKEIQMRGTVVFLKSSPGSKSEGVFPFLYQNKECCVKISLADDNPFENKGLIPYDGQLVEITGERKRSGTIAVLQIRLLKTNDADVNE